MAVIQNGIYWEDLTPEAQERLWRQNGKHANNYPLAWIEDVIEFEDYCHQGTINGYDIFWHEGEEEFFILNGDIVKESFASLEDAKDYCRNQ